MKSRPHVTYLLLLIGCVAGYAWLLHTASHPQSTATVCLVKNTTGLPCPSCGSTRALVAMLQGDPGGLLRWNPLGALVALILFASPIWIAFDVITNKTSLHSFALRAEAFLQRKVVAVPTITLVLLNWIWNFSKNL